MQYRSLISKPYAFATLASSLFLGACGIPVRDMPTLPQVDTVNIERFQGDWYVQEFIPLFPERNAHNGIERYRLMSNGNIATTYRFRNGSFDGPLKTYHPVAEIVPNTGNAHWKMQFLWPFKADYHIAYLAEDYSSVIVARETRDYVWLMTREPAIPDATREKLKQKIKAMGYDISKLKRHPQRWPEVTP